MKNNFRVREQTRASSPARENDSSELTLRLPPKQMQMQGTKAREPMSMSKAEWTDEKHRMYLKSIEASFVNQLYDSKQMLPSFSRKTPSSHPATSSSAQFKVLRGGCWQKISFERENMQKSRINGCHDLTANPWFQHYRSSTKQRSVAAPSLEERVTTSTSQVGGLGQMKGVSSASGFESHVCHQDMVCSDTEMSDQNFVDEEVEGERENNRRNVKRLKSLITDAKGNDRIVPISKSSPIEDVTKNWVSAA